MFKAFVLIYGFIFQKLLNLPHVSPRDQLVPEDYVNPVNYVRS
jgi:hypothetical protein